MADRLVIVVPDAEVQATRDRIAELAIFGWEQHLRLAGGPVRRGGGYAARVASASKILDIVAEFGASSLIIAKEVICENKIIERRPNLYFRSLHLRVLRDRIIPRELISMGSHWREILNDRLAHWHLKRTGVDDWLGQFDELGARWVGEALLRQIDVIDPNKLIQAFQMPAKPFGMNCTFTFISDADPAASSNMIGGWLTKMYGRTRVKDFVSALTTSAPGSRLVICEDALWTGTELRSLLHRLGPGGDLAEAATGKQITFRHSVVTDFGLCIVRHFLDHKELNFVDFHGNYSFCIIGASGGTV